MITYWDESGKFDKSIAVAVEPVSPFYDAEEHHQDYYKKNAFRYALYKK